MEKKVFLETLSKLEELKKSSMEKGEFGEAVISNINGYRLSVTTTPKGVAYLSIIAPSLRNKFVIRDETTLKIVKQLIEEYEKLEDTKKRAIWQFLNGGRKVSVSGRGVVVSL